MKKLLLGIILFSTVNLFAQSTRATIQLKIIDFKGEKCFVYPFALEEVEKDWVDNLAPVYDDFVPAPIVEKEKEVEIPPYYDSLPSGKYVLLEKDSLVRAHFNVAKGVINGNCETFYNDGKTQSKGTYLKGLKNGLWTHHIFEGDCELVNEYQYKDGAKNGAYKEFQCVNNKVYLKEEGIFLSNMKGEANLKVYGVSAEGKSYLQKEALGGKEGILIEKYTHYYPNKQIRLEIKPEDYAKNNFIRVTNYSSGHLEYCHLKELEEIGEIPERVPFTCYYSNGKLFGKFTYSSKTSINTIHYDTIYHSNGKKFSIQDAMSDTLELKRMRIRFFDEEGNLNKQILYLQTSDLYAGWQAYEFKNKTNEKLEIQFANYSLISPLKNLINSRDSLILLWVRCDSIAKNYTYVSPILNMQKFEKTEGKMISMDFTIDSFDTLNYAYQTTQKFDDIKIITYTSRDKNPKAMLRKTPFSLMGKALHNLNGNLKNRLDSMVFYYKDLPFTGEIHLTASNENYITKKQDKILYVNLRPLKGEEFFMKGGVDMEKSSIIFLCKKGDIKTLDVKIEGALINGKAHCEFKNTLPHGLLTGEISMKQDITGQLKEGGKIEAEFFEGLPHGRMREWKLNKKTQKMFLKKDENYYFGIKKDTCFKYNKSGDLSEIFVYDIDGKQHGEQTTFMRDSQAKEVKNYFHGIEEGLSYTLSREGDTLAKYNYTKGLLEGAGIFVAIEENSQSKGIKMLAHYKKGKLADVVECYDASGIKRLEIKIDSSDFVEQYPGIQKGFLQNWESNFKVAGTIKIYYPNGKLYCIGRTNYSTSISYETENDFSHLALDMAEDNSAFKTKADTLYSYDMFKMGVWKYYDIEGNVAKKIIYDDTRYGSQVLTITKNNVLSGQALYEEYYPSGKLKYSGIVISETAITECESDLPEIDYDLVVKDYLSPEGIYIVKNGTGLLKIIHSNGLLRYEIKVVNGNKDGWFKEYNKAEQLCRVGKYVLGNKVGRWLEGDLEGINYLDERCFESMEEEKEYIEENQNIIEIKETVYNTKGDEISSRDYTFKRKK